MPRTAIVAITVLTALVAVFGVTVINAKSSRQPNKPIAQLAFYALALTRLVPGLKLFDIKCAWFNEEEYLEFFPRTLFAQKRG